VQEIHAEGTICMRALVSCPLQWWDDSKAFGPWDLFVGKVRFSDVNNLKNSNCVGLK